MIISITKKSLSGSETDHKTQQWNTSAWKSLKSGNNESGFNLYKVDFCFKLNIYFIINS